MAHVRYVLPVDDPGDREVLAALLSVAGATGVWERATDLVAWFTETTEDVPPGGVWEDEPDVDWQAEWKAGLHPVIAGAIAVSPSWTTDEVPADITHTIVLDPGQAFGTGHHATTTQCLELLQDVPVVGTEVFDVGTGTGILAIAAVLLGATRVVGVDIDAHAVEVARENAERNGVELELAVGSADATDAVFDTVLANLVTDVIVALAPDLVARVRPGGVLIASGISVERRQRAVDALTSAGLTIEVQVDRDGWVALRGTRAA